MTSYGTPRFHMTVWPGIPLPLPRLLPRRAEYRIDDSGRAVIGQSDWLDVRGRLGEVYLELAGAGVGDAAQMVAFASTYGTPSGELVYRDLPGHSWFADLFALAEASTTRQALLEQ